MSKGFSVPQVDVIPTLSCVGYVLGVETTKVSQSGNYLVTTIQIQGVGAGNARNLYFIFRPEWLSFDFDANTLEGLEGNPTFVYRSNIADEPPVISLLQALGGSEEGFSILCTALANVKPSDNSDEDDARYMEEITETFSDFFNEHKPRFGFVLQQQTQKTGVDPETGKGLYRRTRFYDVARYFYPTDDNLKREREKATKTAARITKVVESNKGAEVKKRVPSAYKVTFDEGSPF